MKFVIFLIQLLFVSYFSNAQISSKFDFFLGYGFYDGCNIGTEYQLKKEMQKVSLSAGFDFQKKQESYAVALGWHHAVFKNSKNSLSKYNWHINNRLLAWQYEDDFYLWRVMSFNPSISRSFVIFKKYRLLFDVGPIFNIVFESKRKTFEEIAWPNRIMPNFRILFIL